MHAIFRHGMTALCAFIFSTGAAAQTPSEAGPAQTPVAGSPLNAPAPLPSPQYQSAFEHYRGFEVPQVADWRKANAEVDRIGGWKAYAREAQEDEKSGDAQKADPHSGHH